MTAKGHWVDKGALAGGVILGFVASWGMFAFLAFATYASYGDTSSTLPTLVPIAGLVALPVVSGLLMIRPRSRRAGAGLLMGVAIGSVVGAGVCGTVLGVGGM